MSYKESTAVWKWDQAAHNSTSQITKLQPVQNIGLDEFQSLRRNIWYTYNETND